MPRLGWVPHAHDRTGSGTHERPPLVCSGERTGITPQVAAAFAGLRHQDRNIAAETIELYRGYDAALLTSGVMAGGTRGYDYRADLRAVYQYYCGNHPRPSEVRYPLWQGLRPGSTMTTAGLRGRIEECLGTAGNRTPEQRQKLTGVLTVTKIPEETLNSHLTFATFTFRDIVSNRLGGRNPFSNAGVRYQGSHDDAALNARVERFSADPEAKAAMACDSDLTGKIGIPVLSVHAIGDPTAFGSTSPRTGTP